MEFHWKCVWQPYEFQMSSLWLVLSQWIPNDFIMTWEVKSLLKLKLFLTSSLFSFSVFRPLYSSTPGSLKIAQCIIWHLFFRKIEMLARKLYFTKGKFSWNLVSHDVLGHLAILNITCLEEILLNNHTLATCDVCKCLWH